MTSFQYIYVYHVYHLPLIAELNLSSSLSRLKSNIFENTFDHGPKFETTQSIITTSLPSLFYIKNILPSSFSILKTKLM